MAISAPTASAPDRLTLVAIAIVAGAVTIALHEGLGHGGACVLSGGRNLLISSVTENCSVTNNWITAAGTLVNLAAGGLFFLWARRVRRAVHLRFFLWLAMTFNLLAAAGYWLFSGLGNIGDWAIILAGHHPAWLWHLAMALIGLAVYIAFVWLVVRELKPFLPRDDSRVARAQTLMLVPYFAFGVVNCAAGAFNPVGPVLIVISAAAASFGGASGLCWGWQFVHNPHFASPGQAMPTLSRSRAWIIAGAIAAALLIGVLGPGI